MKYDFSKFPVSDDDKQLNDANGNPATYRESLISAIAADYDGDGQPIRGQAKFLRYNLWKKLKAIPKGSNKLVFFTAEEVALMSAAAQVLSIVVSGQVKEFLDSPESEVTEAAAS